MGVTVNYDIHSGDRGCLDSRTVYIQMTYKHNCSMGYFCLNSLTLKLLKFFHENRYSYFFMYNNLSAQVHHRNPC